MSETVRQSIYQAISSIPLVDPHTHIQPLTPASTTLADILGYHYYTELAHSAGMPKSEIEAEGIGPRELVRRLVGGLQAIDNTANYAWLIQLCRRFFGFEGDRLDESNWESLYEAAETRMASAQWPQMVLEQSHCEAVFLTNDFDDPLTGFDTKTYIPCLRTDDLVFHLAKPEVQARLSACSGIELDGSLGSLRDALRQRFDHFVGSGARACAISLPPSFQPVPISDGRASTAWDHALRQNLSADPAHLQALSRRVFWTLAELCDEYSLPFDLMIGVNRGVYPEGVYQGQDLYDSRVSLTQYRELFNAFPHVKFPISVLASVTNQELVSHAWIFPNVYTHGHWWYSNTPSFIARDAAARLEAVPRNKQVGYYSDAYKLEFVWPKFDMYRRVLAGILTDHFVVDQGWSEEQAIALGHQVLRGNVDQIFARPGEAIDTPPPPSPVARQADQAEAESAARGGGVWSPLEATSAVLAAGAIGMVPINPAPPQGDAGEADFHDPLPSEEEVTEVGIADVQLQDIGSEPIAIEAEAIERLVDDEPLNVGDLTGDDDPGAGDDPSVPHIRMLQGDATFSPDEESLRLQANPVTGEWVMPSGGEDDDEFMLDDIDDESKPS